MLRVFKPLSVETSTLTLIRLVSGARSDEDLINNQNKCSTKQYQRKCLVFSFQELLLPEN